MFAYLYPPNQNFTMKPLQRLESLNTKDCLWVYILRILRDKPMHAYLIRSEIERKFGFRPGTMTAYKVLYLLGKSGLVKKFQEGRRKIYSMTPKGRLELANAVEFYKGQAKILE